MALDTIRHEVSSMLGDVNLRLAEAQHRLTHGSDREKVAAAGELSFLRKQRDMVQERLAEVDAAPAGASESLFRWIKEEVFNLKLRVDMWVAHS